MAINYSISTEIECELEHVWSVMADVEQWHTWTSTMEWIKGLDGSELGVGRRFQIKQPRFAPAIYKVTQFVEGRSFCWESRLPGIRTRADHQLSSTDKATQVVLTFEYSGFLGSLLGLLFARMTKRYLQTEAVGLAHICEQS